MLLNFWENSQAFTTSKKDIFLLLSQWQLIFRGFSVYIFKILNELKIILTTEN